MARRALLTWLENRYLQRYLHGRGIELGALWRRFPLPRDARVWYLDRFSSADLEGHYPELRGNILAPDLIADAMELPVPPGSLDFIIASHVLEHMPFPLKALRTWYDALAPGGALVLKIPDKRHTFDVTRDRTTLQNLIAEHNDPQAFDMRAHYADWVKCTSSWPPGSAAFDDAVSDLIRIDYSIHFNVWIDDDIREIVEFTQKEWKLQWKAKVFWGVEFYRKEITVLLVRQS